jgi:type VI protein secretion system component VasA
VAALRLLLTTPADIPFSDLGIESLRLYINAESNIAATLYELLLNSCDGILLRQPGPRAIPDIVLPATLRWCRSASSWTRACCRCRAARTSDCGC